jgi:endonuclease/exonuclease/phosphatase family metal-dependent hydrolase
MGIHHSRCQLACILLLFGLLLSVAVTAPAQAEPLSILSQNMNRLFDDVDDGNQEKRLTSNKFQARVNDAAARFADDFGLPHIIALQEVENLNVLEQIAARIRQRHSIVYRAVLIPGQDVSSINIGFLVQDAVDIKKIEQLFREQLMPPGTNPLFSRPPLLLQVCYRARCVYLLNLHLRSMRGIDTDTQGERVARKRRRQAEIVAIWSNRLQQLDPAAEFMLLGDFNALTPADEHVDIAGLLRGSPDNSRARLMSRDLVNPDLVDLTRRIPQQQRYSYIYRQHKQQLDYMFVSAPLADLVSHIAYSRIDYRFSDHAGLLVWLDW